MSHSPSETIKLSSWELACMEYALRSASLGAYPRTDIATGTDSALEKLNSIIAAAERELRSRSVSNLMSYSATLLLECTDGGTPHEKTVD